MIQEDISIIICRSKHIWPYFVEGNIVYCTFMTFELCHWSNSCCLGFIDVPHQNFAIVRTGDYLSILKRIPRDTKSLILMPIQSQFHRVGIGNTFLWMLDVVVDIKIAVTALSCDSLGIEGVVPGSVDLSIMFDHRVYLNLWFCLLSCQSNYWIRGLIYIITFILFSLFDSLSCTSQW